MKAFFYKPNIDYDSISHEESEKIIGLIQIVKTGFDRIIDSFSFSADTLRKYFASAKVNYQVKAELSNELDLIHKTLDKILNLCGEIKSLLIDNKLQVIALKEYHNFFIDGEREANKMNFIKLAFTYQYLSIFTHRVQDYWIIIQNIFENLTVTAVNKPVIEEILLNQTYPKLDTCKLLYLIIRRLAYILMISKDTMLHTQKDLAYDLTLHNKTIEVEYTSLLEYNLSVVFQEDVHVIIKDLESTITTSKKIDREKPSELLKKKKKKMHWKDLQEERKTCLKHDFLVDTRGSSIFNQTQYYVMQINEVKLNTQEVKIQKSIYIEIHLEKQASFSKENLIHKFIIQSKFEDRLLQYNHFLKEVFQYSRREILKGMKELNYLDYNLFYYHLGPISFLKYVIKYLKSIRSGFIHRYINNKEMIRELPLDYIKFVLAKWWDINFYQKIPLNKKDSRESYNQITNIIHHKWKIIYKNTIFKEIDNNTKLKALFFSEEREQLLKYLEKKLNYATYLIFLRFLGKDFVYIFKYKKNVI